MDSSLLRRTFWLSIATVGAIGLSVVVVAYAQRDRFSHVLLDD